MALELNVTAADKFFLGEDKSIDVAVYGPDGITPLDISAIPFEWSMRKTDKAPDPAILLKSAGSGLSVIGVYDTNPSTNTQRLRLTFVPTDTATLKADVAYRHSCKRMDVGHAAIIFYGSMNFLQATEH